MGDAKKLLVLSGERNTPNSPIPCTRYQYIMGYARGWCPNKVSLIGDITDSTREDLDFSGQTYES